MRKDVRDLTESSGQRWYGISRETFLGLYSETLASRIKVANALDYDVDQLPDSTVLENRESARSRGYITWLTIYSREQGYRNIESQFFAVHSREPLSPAEAMARAQEGFETSAQTAHGTLEGMIWVGATYGGTWRMVPRTTA